MERADLDPAVHVMLLAGNGKGFCGGYVAGCARPANHVVQHCISNTIGTVASHWALTLGAGAIIGAPVGAVLASLIRIPQRA